VSPAPSEADGTQAERDGSGRLLTVREAAQRLAVSAFTVYGLCDRGELPHVRISNAIRIAPTDMAAFLAGQRSGGADPSGRPERTQERPWRPAG